MPDRMNIESFDGPGSSLGKDLSQRRFTPFVGAGASSLRPSDMNASDVWTRARARIAVLLYKFGCENHDIDAYRFVESLAKERRFALDALPCNNGEDTEVSAVMDLLVALCRLCAYLIGTSCARISDERRYFHFVSQTTISFPQDDRVLCSKMLEAIQACHCLLKDGSVEHAKLLFPDLILDKLQYFVCRLRLCRNNPSNDTEFKLLRCESPTGCDYRSRRFANEGVITLSEIDWFCELVWHVLRFDTPAYPTTRELTFITSLQMNQTCLEEIRCLDLSETAELLGASMSRAQVMKTLSSYFERLEEIHSKSQNLLYKNLAATAQHYFTTWSNGDTIWNIPIPILMTTNYDRLIELELQKANCPHHVVYPVLLAPQESVSNADFDVRWCWLDRFPSGSTWASGVPEDCTDWDPIELELHAKNRIRGPLVVKLHGSPQHPLFDKGVPADKCLSHFIVLSASSYVAAMVTSGQPKWLSNVLAGNRAIWFLGCSLSDWNIRMLLFNNLQQHAHSAQPQTRVLLDRSIDPYKHAVMPSLGVSICVGELEDFGNRLRNELRMLCKEETQT